MDIPEIRNLPVFQPVYLHFLDRELRESVEGAPPSITLEGAIRILLLATPARLYCGQSPAWEGTTASLVRLLAELISAGQLDLLSHYNTVAEFLHSKQLA